MNKFTDWLKIIGHMFLWLFAGLGLSLSVLIIIVVINLKSNTSKLHRTEKRLEQGVKNAQR
jgi:phage-related holin